MRVLVTGSRDWSDRGIIESALAEYGAGDVLVHGGARGADTIASEVAPRGMVQEIHRPDWASNPRGAGLVRNLRMLDTKPDVVLAFQLDDTPGTRHCVNEARKRGIPVRVFPDTETPA